MVRALVWGALTVIWAHALWFGAIAVHVRWGWLMPLITALLFVVTNIAGLAAFLVAYRAPRHRLLLALIMAPFAAVLGTFSNLLLEDIGMHMSFTGPRGSVMLFAVSLAYGVLVAAIGGGMGAWLGRGHAPIEAPIPVEPAVLTTPLPEINLSPSPATMDLPEIRSN